jgi:hypothetical protein
VCSVYGREKKRKEKRRNEENKEKKHSVSLKGCISFKRNGTISALFLEAFGEPL